MLEYSYVASCWIYIRIFLRRILLDIYWNILTLHLVEYILEYSYVASRWIYIGIFLRCILLDIYWNILTMHGPMNVKININVGQTPQFPLPTEAKTRYNG